MSSATTRVLRADVVVIGAGAAGPVVVRKLLDHTDADVLLIEAGADYGRHDTGSWPADLLDADTLPDSHDWGYRGPGHGGTWAFGRARVVGGCTAHNGCSQTAGVRADYEALGIDWAPGELDARVAALLREGRAEQPAEDELTPFQGAMLDAFAETGIARTDDLADLDGVAGCGPAPMNSPDGVRWNSAFGYLDDVRDHPRLRILAGAEVDRLVVEHGSVVAALARDDAGAVTEVRGDRFVLCAGAYGSPEILLRSGIGPADELRALGIEVAVDLPGVGANLHDHVTVEVRFAATETLVAATAAFGAVRRAPDEQVIAKARSGHGPAPYDLHLFPFTDLASGRLEAVIPAGVVAPRSRGRLRLVSADPAARAELDHGYLRDPADAAALRAGLDLVRGAAATTALAPLLGAAVPDPVTGADHTFFHYWHPAGTCAIGSVVDTTGRVHGLANVHVIDTSLFPQVPRATTHLPTGLLADRLSDDLVGRAFPPPDREVSR
ncbi:MAG: GMC family oxidoreductase [Nocardioidaceae bacterium]|nr:GMC family oxidoreductase [Nocardioidaceae bacterium]